MKKLYKINYAAVIDEASRLIEDAKGDLIIYNYLDFRGIRENIVSTHIGGRRAVYSFNITPTEKLTMIIEDDIASNLALSCIRDNYEYWVGMRSS